MNLLADMWPEPTTQELDQIAEALGNVPNVAYEAAHVYPMSAPDFRLTPGSSRRAPTSGPIKLYAHLPFCNYACRFCFYAKRIGRSREDMERYIHALRRELAFVPAGTPLQQLYLGGGTPTAIPADLLDELLGSIFDHLKPTAGVSRSVESSPESLSPEHIRVLQSHGVERVSMGIQTMDEDVLAAINRRHDREQALDSSAALIEAGFFTNVDLMYGLPGQTEESFCRDLEDLAAQGPDSFTLYDLRLNEKTPLLGTMHTVDRFTLERLMRWRGVVLAATRALGYHQTRWHTFVRTQPIETSYDRAPCVDGFAAGSQLGVGMSAVSHLGGTVYRNHESLAGYLDRIEAADSPVDGTFVLDQNDYKTLFVTRTIGDGNRLSLREYEETFARPIEADFGEIIGKLKAAGLLESSHDQLFLSEKGRRVYDLVTLCFYPEGARRWLLERQPASDRPQVEGAYDA